MDEITFTKSSFIKVMVNARKNMRISQERLADEIGVSPQTIVNWENASVKTLPGIDKLAEISRVLNISPNALVLGYDISKTVGETQALTKAQSVINAYLNFSGIMRLIDLLISTERGNEIANHLHQSLGIATNPHFGTVLGKRH